MYEHTPIVFKEVVWWLVDQSRDAAAKRLKDCDVTDQRVRDIIMREINTVKSNLKELLRISDFLTSGISDAYIMIRWRKEYLKTTTAYLRVCSEQHSIFL